MKIQKYPETIVSLGVVGLILLMVLPVSATVLDFFLVLSFMFSVAILLICVSSKRVLDFSIFPSVLLLATLFRLALNVASTRLILGHGDQGAHSAGAIIKTFGEVIVQNNFFVGAIIFLILVSINFIVITKGAGRISEVAARFTLDALPGKQAAIESDLRSKNISPNEAQKKRDDLDQQADFYGAMDGASKFVRGDAIAGILITLINIVGGLIVGVFQKGMGFSSAAQNYTLMTIGDGLVSQVPALMVSTAAGIIITRASSSKNSLNGEVGRQMNAHRHILLPLSFILAGVGLFITEAKIPFFLLAGCCFWLSRKKGSQNEESDSNPGVAASPALLEYKAHSIVDSDWIPRIDPETELTLELSSSLLAHWKEEGELLEKANDLRKKLIREMGCFVPPIKIIDNMHLPLGTIRFLCQQEETFRLRLYPKRLLALRLKAAQEPSVLGIGMESTLLGVKGLWIQESERRDLSAKEFLFTDALSFAYSHVDFVLRERLYEFFNYSELEIVLGSVSENDPELSQFFQREAEGALLLKSIKQLLNDGVSVSDSPRIMRALKGLLSSNDGRGSFDSIYQGLREELGDLLYSSLVRKNGPLTPQFFSQECARQLTQIDMLNSDLIQKLKKEILALSLTAKGLWIVPAKHRKSLAMVFGNEFPSLMFLSDREFLSAHQKKHEAREVKTHG